MDGWKLWNSGKVLIASLAVSVILTLPVYAQDPQLCVRMNQVIGYKILLDDIHLTSGSPDAQQKELMDLLNFQLGKRLENQDVELASQYHLVRCDGRVPQGESSFPPLTIEGLVNRDVVLEVWGEIFPPIAGRHHVFLNYAMLPLPSSNVSPFLQRDYQPRAGSSPEEIADWLANLDELNAYAMIARAVRLLSIQGTQAYDGANRDFHTASQSLRHAFGATPTPPQKRLLAFVTEQKCRILRDARTNAQYHGPLQRLPDTVLIQECPAGGVQ